MSDNINGKTRDALVQAGLSLDTANKGTSDAAAIVAKLLAPLTAARTALANVQGDLNAADPKTVDANALANAAHALCERVGGQRDALIALAEAVLTALVGSIDARQVSKDLHVLLAEIEVKKAKGEDVFGLAAKLRDFKGLVPAKPGEKK